MTPNRLAQTIGLRKLTGAFLATTALVSALSTPAAVAQPYQPGGAVQDVSADSSGYGGQLALPIGGSRILRFSRPIGQVLVGNPKVGDIVPLGERTLYVLGKSTGATSLTVMPRGGGAPLATMDLRIGYDVENIRRATHELMPDEPLDVSVRGDGVVLTGALSSSAAVARAAAIAEQYAPGHIVNLASVRAAEQVMLSVRVAEVQRNALQQLGLNNFNALWDTTRTLTLAPPVVNPDTVANLIGKWTSGKNWTFQSLFDALETHGFASTLAEPNLVALSGETAVFFAGGEYPVPVPQTGMNSNTITIEYKQYGVSIGFTPTVVGDTINLVVAPEVSALDYANAVTLQGFKIPALTSRRAKTTVELRNGQSFAIAGLIRREFTDNLKGIPGVQRTPLFGALLRSTSYNNNETEVMIIVTAHLAKPTNRENLVAPTDLREGPSETELLLMGHTDKPIAPGRPSASLAPSSTPASANATPSAETSPAAAAKAPATQPQPAAAPPPPAVASAPALTPAPAPVVMPAPAVAMSTPVAPAPVAAISPPMAKPAAPPASAPLSAAMTAAPSPVAAPRPMAAAGPTPAVAMSTPVVPAPVAAVSPPVAKPAASPVSAPFSAAMTAAPSPVVAPRPMAAAAPVVARSTPIALAPAVVVNPPVAKPVVAPVFAPPATTITAAPKPLVAPRPMAAPAPVVVASAPTPKTPAAPVPAVNAPPAKPAAAAHATSAAASSAARAPTPIAAMQTRMQAPAARTPAVTSVLNATSAPRPAPLRPVTVGPLPVATAAPTTVSAKWVVKAEIAKPQLTLDPTFASRAPATSSDR